MTRISKVHHHSHPAHAKKGYTSAKNAKRLITKYGQEKFNRIIMACENIKRLSRDLGLGDKELFKIAKYIEVKLKDKVKKGKVYLRKEKTGLARTIEYKRGRTYIHLKTHGVSAIRDAKHMLITPSIRYAAHKPELVANWVGDKTLRKQAKMLKKLKKTEGILQIFASSSHKNKAGKKVHSIITKLYNAGSLKTYEYRLEKLSSDEKVKVARDLLVGLENIHKQKLAHGALDSTNLIVHRGKKVSAAIKGFTKATPLAKAKAKDLAPFRSMTNAKRKDVKKLEGYALALNLYQLYFGATPEWCTKMHKRISKKEMRQQIRYTLAKRACMPNKENKTLGNVILNLLDPKKPLSISQARKILDSELSLLA